MSCNAKSCHVVLHGYYNLLLPDGRMLQWSLRILLCYIPSHDVVLCVMSCHAVSCPVMLCHVMLCPFVLHEYNNSLLPD